MRSSCSSSLEITITFEVSAVGTAKCVGSFSLKLSACSNTYWVKVLFRMLYRCLVLLMCWVRKRVHPNNLHIFPCKRCNTCSWNWVSGPTTIRYTLPEDFSHTWWHCIENRFRCSPWTQGIQTFSTITFSLPSQKPGWMLESGYFCLCWRLALRNNQFPAFSLFRT